MRLRWHAGSLGNALIKPNKEGESKAGQISRKNIQPDIKLSQNSDPRIVSNASRNELNKRMSTL